METLSNLLNNKFSLALCHILDNPIRNFNLDILLEITCMEMEYISGSFRVLKQ